MPDLDIEGTTRIPSPRAGDAIDLDAVVGQVMTAITPHVGEGKVADYIPALGEVDPKQFGFAVATVDGQVHAAGNCDVKFSIQSISKVFTLALVLGHDDKAIWERVHREPSGNAFNSLFQLEFEKGIPRNPFINAGAIVTTDQLLADTGDAFLALRTMLRTETGNADIHVDGVTAASEAETGHRNRALAHLMADFGNMRNEVGHTLDHYFRQCSVTITARELATAGLLLARHGIQTDGTRLISREDARRIMAIMLTCGTYDAAGDFAYRIGIPCKSGVGGGILGIVPDRGAVVGWGPGLDPRGNSVTAALAIDAFTHLTGWTVF